MSGYISSYLQPLLIPQAKRLGGKLYIPYFYQDKQYVTILPILRSSSWDSALADGEDVTSELESYAGPWKNFFGLKYKVEDLLPNAEKLVLTLQDTPVGEFDHDTIIQIE